MNSLFTPTDASKILQRFDKLTPNAQRQWGKMSVTQMLAHCNISVETAMGVQVYKQLLMGRVLAPFFKGTALGPKPFTKNSPTDKSYKFGNNLNFETEKAKVLQSISAFAAGGPAACTAHPHPFFGKLTPDEWAVLMWKHLDHHLRQFGV